MPMRIREPIVRSIVMTILGFYVFQVVLFSTILIVQKIPFRDLAAFAAVSLAFHALLCLFLYLSRESFYVEETGLHLESVNLANKVTLARISTLPTILFLILMLREYKLLAWVLVIIILTFLTDMLDGKISRGLHQVTRIGRMLDSISDYCLLGVISIVYFSFELLPVWFFAVIIFRLGFQAVGMGIFIIIEKRARPESSMMGKVAIATTMVLYALELFRFLPVAGMPLQTVISVCEYVAAAILVVSVGEKGYGFYRRARELKAAKKPGGPRS